MEPKPAQMTLDSLKVYKFGNLKKSLHESEKSMDY